jgi:hypothetical protein
VIDSLSKESAMRIRRHLHRFVAVALCVGALSAVGCSKKIKVLHRPPWTTTIQRIAVVPFRNESGVAGAGRVVSDQFAAALAGNQAYRRVYNRSDLRHIMDERKLQQSFANNPSAIAEFRRWGKVDAILVGSVQQYAATSRNERKREPVKVWDKTTQQMVWTGAYKSWVHTRNEANVSATATLIRVSDGATIYATPGPVLGRAWSESGYGGKAPKYDPNACLAAAALQAVSQLLSVFGVTEVEVKIGRDDFLLVTGPPFDGEWPDVKEFRSTDEKMFVMLRLPPVCDGKTFAIAIARKGGRQNLAQTTVVWNKAYSQQGMAYPFSPKDLAAKGGGPGEYVAKFYAGPEPVLDREFNILP